MTLNRSTVRVRPAEYDAPRHPHLRVCPPPTGMMHPRSDQDVFSADELDLIALFADGLCIEAIARRLGLSDRTIRRRSRALCDRIGVVSTIQVVAWAARRHFI